MSSPFPGMDPYIEACGLWEDFHDSLIAEVKRALAERVPGRYAVRSGERTYVVLVAEEGWGWGECMAHADVAIPTSLDAESGAASATGTTVAERTHADLKPITMRAFVEAEVREAFIEIRELSPEQRLVTRIEVLSPLNKRPDASGWYHYQRVRQPYMEGAVANLVEIDLLRGGKRMPM